MLEAALRYPTRGEAWPLAALVGAGLLLVGAVLLAAAAVPALVTLAGGAVLAQLLLRGYYVRVLRRAAADAPAPGFDAWGDLLADGLRAVVAALAYLAPGTGLGALALGIAGVAAGHAEPLAAVLRGAAGVAAVLALLSLVGAAYVLPAAVANFAVRRRFRAAFDLRAVADAAATEDYAVAWLLALLVQALVLPVAYLLRVVLVGFLVHFHVAVAARYLYGRGFAAATGAEAVVASEDADDASAPERRGASRHDERDALRDGDEVASVPAPAEPAEPREALKSPGNADSPGDADSPGAADPTAESPESGDRDAGSE